MQQNRALHAILAVGVLGLATACVSSTGGSGGGGIGAAIDPNSLWLVRPTSATIANSNNGSSWDGDNSPPDVIVTTICPNGKLVKSAKVESYSPTWSTGGCVVTAAELQEKGIDFRLVDSDVVADDTITPLIHSSVSLVALGLGSLTVAPASGGCKTIAFDFTEQ